MAEEVSEALECDRKAALLKHSQWSSTETQSHKVMPLSIDVHHEKTDLKVFVVVIPKEGWACMAAPILLFA